jgi:aminoacyl tRNA synthase complex-interacting multifunctional protein 1
MLGFPMNGTSPIGGFVDVPILISHELMELQPPKIYLGGGDDDVKLYFNDVKEFVTKTNAIVGRITETRYIGKEGTLFRGVSAESNPPSASTTPDNSSNITATATTTTTTTPPLPPPVPASTTSSSSTQKTVPANTPSKKRQEKEKDVVDDEESGGTGGGGSEIITFNDLDVRVGKVVKCWKHPDSDKLICEEIDVGESTPRAIASGLQKYYTPEKFEGQRVLVVCNLKPAKLGGFVSNGMVLCASWKDAEGTDMVKLIRPSLPDAKIGERVIVETSSGGPVTEPASSTQVKKRNIFSKVAEELLTSLDGIIKWQNKNLITINTKSTIEVEMEGKTLSSSVPVGSKVS